jgi:hypothetical protein
LYCKKQISKKINKWMIIGEFIMNIQYICVYTWHIGKKLFALHRLSASAVLYMLPNCDRILGKYDLRWCLPQFPNHLWHPSQNYAHNGKRHACSQLSYFWNFVKMNFKGLHWTGHFVLHSAHWIKPGIWSGNGKIEPQIVQNSLFCWNIMLFFMWLNH